MRKSPEQEPVAVIGFGRRLLAALLDGVLLTFATTLLAGVFGLIVILISGTRPPDQPFPVDKLFFACGLILPVAYYVGFWTKSGQTIGKAFVGIRVIGADGSGISWGKALLRYVGYIVSGLVFSLGFLWIALDRKRQGWHDKFAGTFVIYVDDEFSAADSVELEPSDPGRAWIWLILWFVVAVVTPAGFLSGVWFFGPIINRIFSDIVQGL